MIEFAKCLLYLALIGIVGFAAGRMVPKKWFRHDRFPYRPCSVEKEGLVYRKLRVNRWKSRVPDMSVILPMAMPSKRIPGDVTPAHLELMIQETCVAEWTHGALSLLGFGCVLIWKSIGGWILSFLYAFGNLPYIIIQRYNRPKLLRLQQRLLSTQQKGGEVQGAEGCHIEL